MKRKHRQWQRRAWLLLAPAAGAMLVLALMYRQDVPANIEWPAFLVAPVAARSV